MRLYQGVTIGEAMRGRFFNSGVLPSGRANGEPALPEGGAEGPGCIRGGRITSPIRSLSNNTVGIPEALCRSAEG
jgi:hypothetical protein